MWLEYYCNEWSKPQTWPWKCSPFSTNIKKWLGMKVCFRSTFNGQATPFKVAAAFEWTSNWGQMSIHLLWSMKCHNYRDLVFSMLSYSNYTLPAVKIDSLWIHLFLSLFIFPILEGNYNFNFPIHYCKVTSIIDTVILSFIDLQQLPRNSMQDNGNDNADVSLFWRFEIIKLDRSNIC